MIPSQALNPLRRRFLISFLATLVLTVASCNSSIPSASPFASANSSQGAQLSASVAPEAGKSPTLGPVITLPPAATRPQTIEVLESPVDWTSVPVGKLTGCTDTTGCQGDELIGRSQMLDAASQTHVQVGTFFGVCYLIDPSLGTYSCPANTITLTGRGQIVYTETHLCFGTSTASPFCDGPWPILGGTGEFLGATGTVSVPADTKWQYLDAVISFTK